MLFHLLYFHWISDEVAELYFAVDQAFLLQRSYVELLVVYLTAKTRHLDSLVRGATWSFELLEISELCSVFMCKIVLVDRDVPGLAVWEVKLSALGAELNIASQALLGM